MVYNSEEFKQRVDLLLSSTKQYIFLSSGRVYANDNKMITESSPRLLDISEDLEYLKTDEYALAKAREENSLFNHAKKNWTIVRPYITYNFNRLQLGVFEKEIWLQRALRGKPIVFSKDVAECFTTLTYGYDVAEVMSYFVGRTETLGQVYSVTCGQAKKWGGVLDIYLDEIKAQIGVKPSVYWVDNYSCLLPLNHYQTKYDRLFNRSFDNSKTEKLTNKHDFVEIEIGLRKCIREFIEHQTDFNFIDWQMEAIMDRVCGYQQRYSEILGIRNKIKYFLFRHVPVLGKIVQHVWKFMKR